MQTFSHSTIACHEAQLIELARLGETSGLVEYVYLECLPSKARYLARMFGETCGARLDVEDILQSGIEYALHRLDKAVQAVNPIGFLTHAAHFAMLHYCQEQRGPVRVPFSSQRRGAVVPIVMSLDAPLVGGEDLTLLDLLAG